MRERAERDLDLQMALGPALFATKARSHPDIGRAYARAWELCRQLGDHRREFTALRGLQLHHVNLLELEKSQNFAEEALRVAKWLGDAARLVRGYVTLGTVLYHQGNSSRRSRTFGGASSCSSRIRRVLIPLCNATSGGRSFPGCSGTRTDPSTS